MVTMFVKLNSQSSVCLRKRFLLFLQHRKIAKAKKRAYSFEREPKKILVACAVRNSTL